MLREGTILDGAYRLVRSIGTGGMGTVWLGDFVTEYDRKEAP